MRRVDNVILPPMRRRRRRGDVSAVSVARVDRRVRSLARLGVRAVSGSPPTAGACAPGDGIRRVSRAKRDGRALHPRCDRARRRRRCCGKRRASTGRRRGACRTLAVRRAASERSGVHRRRDLRPSVARRCGWSASPAPTARRRAPSGSRNALDAQRHARGGASARSATASLGAPRAVAHTTPDAALVHEMLAQLRAQARARSRWKCRRTASIRAASTASRSTSRCSPT